MPSLRFVEEPALRSLHFIGNKKKERREEREEGKKKKKRSRNGRGERMGRRRVSKRNRGVVKGEMDEQEEIAEPPRVAGYIFSMSPLLLYIPSPPPL